MRAGIVAFGLACAGILGAIVSGCGSSDSGGTPDSGHVADASKPHHEAGKEASAKDSGSKDTAPMKEASTPEAATCSGLDAAISGVGAPAACETCIGSYCCAQGLACADLAGCKDIVVCELACVKAGGSAQDCVMGCILGEAGAPPDGGLTHIQNTAYSLAVSGFELLVSLRRELRRYSG